MKIMLEEGAFEPIREHDTDAGLDIRSMYDGKVPAGGSNTFHTGVHVELPHGTAGLFVSKSGLMMHNDITSTGLIDENFSGEIMVKLFNHGQRDYWVAAGDKVAQLVVVPVRYEEVEVVDHIKIQGRGLRGYGSTGR